MSHNKKDYGNPFDNDPGDEVEMPEEEQFELLRDTGFAPADLGDEEFAARYSSWLKAETFFSRRLVKKDVPS
jgi:hypothetical protein